MVRIREEQLLREHSEHQKQLQQVMESLKDKLSQSEGKAVTLVAGRHGNMSEQNICTVNHSLRDHAS